MYNTTAPMTPFRATNANRKAHIAGGLLVFASPLLFLVALLAMALALGGFSHEPAQPSALDALLVLVMLAVPASGFVLGCALLCNQRWARRPAMVVAALSCVFWLLAPLFLPALILLAVDAERERERAIAIAR